MARRKLLQSAVLTSIAALLVAAAVYVLAGIQREPDAAGKPQIAFEAAADRYLSGEVFDSAKDYSAFKRLIVDLAERHGISVYVASAGRLQPGMQVATTIEAGRERAAKHLASLPETFNRRDALVLVLVEEPRTFELLGLGGVQDTFRIRGISAGHGLRHLQLIFVLESQHGTPLIEAVKRIDLSLGPLNPFIRYFPAGPGFVEGLLEWAGDSPTTPTGSGIVAALVGLGQRVLGEGGSIPWGAIPVLILGLVLLNLVASWVVGRVLEVPLHLLKGWVGQPLAGLASLAADLVGDLVPVIGGFAILVYGSLSQVIAIAQQSGGEVAPLIRLTRSANSADLEVPALLAMLLAIAYVLAQGFRVAQHLDLAEVRIASLRGLLTILTAVVLVAAAWMLAVVIFSLEGSLGTLVRGVFSVQALAIIALALLWPTAHTDAAPPPPPPPLPLPQRKPRP